MAYKHNFHIDLTLNFFHIVLHINFYDFLRIQVYIHICMLPNSYLSDTSEHKIVIFHPIFGFPSKD